MSTSSLVASPRLRFALVLVLGGALGACGSCKGSPGPLVDQPPADLGPSGVFIEQPKGGETITGQWVAVSGWFDPARFQAVLVAGAPVDGFYEGTGHMGAPSVPVVTSRTGRFVAPRVPLAEGTTTLTLLPVPVGGAPVEPITLEVTGQTIRSVPATVVPRPFTGGVPLEVSFKANAAGDVPGWQWDFDADGTFDAEGQTPTHTFEKAGDHAVLARTKVEGRWVYAVTRVLGTEPSPATHSAALGANARLLSVVPGFPPEPLRTTPEGLLVVADEPADELAGTRLVVVVDDEGVKAFSPALAPLFVLRGLGEVRGVAGDAAGRVWVATPTEVRRFSADGTPDRSFGDAGVRGGFTSIQALCVSSAELQATADAGLVDAPHALTVFEDGVVKECGETSCEATGPRLEGATGMRCGADLLLDSRGTAGVLWVGSEPHSAGVGGWEPVSGGTGFKDLVARKPGETLPYLVGVSAEGAVAEWFVKGRPARTQDLPYSAETACVDDAATRIRTNRARSTDRRFDVWPVVYVAGAGRLERRLFSGLAKGGW